MGMQSVSCLTNVVFLEKITHNIYVSVFLKLSHELLILGKEEKVEVIELEVPQGGSDSTKVERSGEELTVIKPKLKRVSGKIGGGVRIRVAPSCEVRPGKCYNNPSVSPLYPHGLTHIHTHAHTCTTHLV